MQGRAKHHRRCRGGGGNACRRGLRADGPRNSRPARRQAALAAIPRSRRRPRGSAAPKGENARHPRSAIRRRSANAACRRRRLSAGLPLRLRSRGLMSWRPSHSLHPLARVPRGDTGKTPFTALWLNGAADDSVAIRSDSRELAGNFVPAREQSPLTLAALLGGVLLFRAGQLLGMDDGLIDRAAGGAETGELAVIAVALQHIDRRDRLAADLIGGSTFEDCPVHSASAGLLFDILKAAIDDRVERIELALDFSVRHPAAASGRSAAPAVARIAAPITIAPAPVALTLFPLTPFPLTRFALIGCSLFSAARAIGAPIAVRSASGALGRGCAAAFGGGRRPGSRSRRASTPAVAGAGRAGAERARRNLARCLRRARPVARRFAVAAPWTLRNRVTRTPAAAPTPAWAWCAVRCGGLPGGGIRRRTLRDRGFSRPLGVFGRRAVL